MLFIADRELKCSECGRLIKKGERAFTGAFTDMEEIICRDCREELDICPN